VAGEGFVPKLREWLARIAHGDGAEEIEEHEKAIRGLRCFEGLCKAVLGNGGGLHVRELGHVGAFGIEHPNDVASDGLLHNSLANTISHIEGADQRCDEEMAKVWTCLLGVLAACKVAKKLVGLPDNGRILGRQTEEKVEEVEVGLNGLFRRMCESTLG
jgi:hypothetical protein